MKNLRAICDAANAYEYGRTKDFDATFTPNQVRKLLDVIELQREALEFYSEGAPYIGFDRGDTAREALAKSEELLKND